MPKQKKSRTREALRLEELGYVGKTIRHKATGHVGVLVWSGKDFDENVGIDLPNHKWATIYNESEFEVVKEK